MQMNNSINSRIPNTLLIQILNSSLNKDEEPSVTDVYTRPFALHRRRGSLGTRPTRQAITLYNAKQSLAFSVAQSQVAGYVAADSRRQSQGESHRNNPTANWQNIY